MEKFHPLLAALLLILLLAHLISGAVTLLTGSFVSRRWLLYMFLAAVCLHAAVALWRTLRHKRLRDLLAYPGKNKTFWLRIISGVAVLVLVLIHRTLWTERTGFGILPKSFGQGSLAVQMLFVAVLLIHILSNLRPLFLDFGMEASSWKKKCLQGFFLAALCGAAVCVVAYYLGVSL